jgi:hypothetical protein
MPAGGDLRGRTIEKDVKLGQRSRSAEEENEKVNDEDEEEGELPSLESRRRLAQAQRRHLRVTEGGGTGLGEVG